MELNQKDKKLQEIQNIVNRIKAYREEGKLNLTIDIEKSFVTYLIEEDLPTIYFVEYKWAEVPKKINNTKLVTEENAQKELIIIKSEKDSKLKSNWINL